MQRLEDCREDTTIFCASLRPKKSSRCSVVVGQLKGSVEIVEKEKSITILYNQAQGNQRFSDCKETKSQIKKEEALELSSRCNLILTRGRERQLAKTELTTPLSVEASPKKVPPPPTGVSSHCGGNSRLVTRLAKVSKVRYFTFGTEHRRPGASIIFAMSPPSQS